MKALTGSGLQVDGRLGRNTRRVYVPPRKIGGKVVGKMRTCKKKIGVEFINEPLSNHDLLRWVKKKGIRNFRGIYSRDNLPSIISNKECGIINLDDMTGAGTQLVCYRNIDDNFFEYFDSFGMAFPKNVDKYLSKSGKDIIYSGDEKQERLSVLRDYWCLYYLIERQKGTSIFDVIHDTNLDPNDQMINNDYIKKYFMRNII